MLGKIKKGLGDAKSSADIETEYLMAKNKNNFDHPAENGVRIKAYQDAYTAAEDFYDRLKSWNDQFKDLIASEQKLVEKMNASAQLATISSIFSTFTASQQNIVGLRQQMLGKVNEYILTPAKKFLGDQTPIKNKIDQTNKSWIELRYWRKKNKSDEEKEAKHSYDKHTEELFRMFDNSIDAQVAQWVKYFADFEVEFFANAANVAPRI